MPTNAAQFTMDLCTMLPSNDWNSSATPRHRATICRHASHERPFAKFACCCLAIITPGSSMYSAQSMPCARTSVQKERDIPHEHSSVVLQKPSLSSRLGMNSKNATMSDVLASHPSLRRGSLWTSSSSSRSSSVSALVDNTSWVASINMQSAVQPAGRKKPSDTRSSPESAAHCRTRRANASPRGERMSTRLNKRSVRPCSMPVSTSYGAAKMRTLISPRNLEAYLRVKQGGLSSEAWSKFPQSTML
mmetsp:Transcript_17227/g.46984  ORF Transcript_17227/g.46984 Transcript_17227/m.46984 type:complete len:247 (-) Transcript_17227:1086-1826(-)